LRLNENYTLGASNNYPGSDLLIIEFQY